jgi:hypothetical protein
MLYMEKKPYRYIFCACVLILTACTAQSGPVEPPGIATANATSLSKNPPADCPVTRAPGTALTSPAPYPATPPPEYTDQFWYGSAELWTMLGADGTWYGLPHSTAGYTQKVFWWRQGYNPITEPSPALTVSGKRLDGSAPALVASKATDAIADFGNAMLVGVEVPTTGCWKITGHYQGHNLSFVVWVMP